MPMEQKTNAPEGADRRQGDRRVSPSADYRGPERRAADRRSGGDRRQSPRVTVAD